MAPKEQQLRLTFDLHIHAHPTHAHSTPTHLHTHFVCCREGQVGASRDQKRASEALEVARHVVGCCDSNSGPPQTRKHP